LHGSELIHIQFFLLALLAMLVAAKLGAEIAERLGQPSVLGEIVAGMVVGTTGLGWIVHSQNATGEVYRLFSLTGIQAQATYQALNALAEIGVIVLLFEIGLHSDLYELRRVGKSALWVGFAGVTLPMLGGYFVSRYGFHFEHFTSLFIGAALTATSVGITARVFQDMKMLQTSESQVVLGAAVADDVIGLIILAVVMALAPNHDPGAAAANPLVEGIKVTVFSLGFLTAALVIGVRCVPMIDKLLSASRSRGAMTVVSLVFCLLIAMAGQYTGLAMIVGAFTAGLVLSHSSAKEEIQAAIKPIADLFIPLFFAMTGSVINLRVLGQGSELIMVAVVLTVVAVVGKVVGSMTVPDKSLSRWVVGLAMIPRGEVGLIYARAGMQHGWLSGVAADGLILMVMATTLMTPPVLRTAMVKMKRAHGEPVTEEMAQIFSPPETTLERADWEVFNADTMLVPPEGSNGGPIPKIDSNGRSGKS
jgi:Kef-type K+ transport system membrane component KefB